MIPHQKISKYFSKGLTLILYFKSRIAFPLKLAIIGGEGESDTTKFLQKKDWLFQDPQKAKDIIVRPERIGKTTATVHLLIDETGFSVYHNFENRKGRWWMTSIKDESD